MNKEKVYRIIEILLWKIRHLILFPVVFLVIALVYLIFLMGERMWQATLALTQNHDAFEVLILLIDIVDFTLIAVIILLIIWGVYELFIRDMSLREQMYADKMLIHNIDELKQKLGKVVIVSLVVHVFKQALIVHVDGPLDLVMMGLMVVLLSAALYLSEKMGKCDHE